MLDVIEQLPHRLETTVADGGLNFSVGQRQLLCLARGTPLRFPLDWCLFRYVFSNFQFNQCFSSTAILRRSKILILDEPTANVDSRTDKLLQDAVANSFQGATIIAVAHRLDVSSVKNLLPFFL